MKIIWDQSEVMAELYGTKYTVKLYNVRNFGWSWSVGVAFYDSNKLIDSYKGGRGLNSLEDAKKHLLAAYNRHMIRDETIYIWPEGAEINSEHPDYSPYELSVLDPDPLNWVPVEYVGKVTKEDVELPFFLIIMRRADKLWSWYVWERGMNPPYWDDNILEKGKEPVPFAGQAQFFAEQAFRNGINFIGSGIHDWDYQRHDKEI